METRATIKAEKQENGMYVMVCELPSGIRELPQEGREHASKSSVYSDAKLMYKGCFYDYNQRNKTISI